jgi:hypothetical protein
MVVLTATNTNTTNEGTELCINVLGRLWFTSEVSAIDSKDSLPKQLNTFEAPYEAPYVRSYGAPTGIRNRF